LGEKKHLGALRVIIYICNATEINNYMNSMIAIVNPNDKIIGYSDKLDVHLQGIMHRAFSIFVFNNKGELMLQRRALEKYHSPGLWTNTCCSHLPMDMKMEDAVHIRLKEEMGFDTDLQYVTKFHYNIKFENGLTENEIDHIFIGFYNDNPKPNSEEVVDYKWITLNDLIVSIEEDPNNYTYWLKHIVQNYYDEVRLALEKGLKK
jgi:isopentenyl-diphosphate delta-isomerase